MGLDAELLDVLKRHCSSLGNSFISKGASKVLAQPSNRLLFAKTGSVDQVLGEAESLNAMFKASQAAGHSETLIPSIHAFGKTESGLKAFLVTDYKNLSSGLSSSSQQTLGTKLAEMHLNGTSENAMYGFDRPTHCGATVSAVYYCDCDRDAIRRRTTEVTTKPLVSDHFGQRGLLSKEQQ